MNKNITALLLISITIIICNGYEYPKPKLIFDTEGEFKQVLSIRIKSRIFEAYQSQTKENDSCLSYDVKIKSFLIIYIPTRYNTEPYKA